MLPKSSFMLIIYLFIFVSVEKNTYLPGSPGGPPGPGGPSLDSPE